MIDLNDPTASNWQNRGATPWTLLESKARPLLHSLQEKEITSNVNSTQAYSTRYFRELQPFPLFLRITGQPELMC